MKQEQIDYEKLRRMEKNLGCTFLADGDYAEMSLDLADYRERTEPIDGVCYGFYRGNREDLRRIVAQVDEEWVQYFGEDTPVFCGYWEGRAVCFCIVDVEADCIVSNADCRVGSIGCVGTVPACRGRGIGLRMVDLATVYLRNQGCDKASVSYTGIAHWYQKLGYETFAQFSFLKDDPIEAPGSGAPGGEREVGY